MKKGSTNPIKRKVIADLKKGKNGIWKKIAEILEKPRRKEINVNLWKINKFTKEGDTIIVPGKVLGNGELGHKVNVAAFAFSKTANEKLGNNVSCLYDLMKKNPKGTGIKILK